MNRLIEKIISDDRMFIIFMLILILIVILILLSIIKDKKKKVNELTEEEKQVLEMEKQQAKLELEKVVKQMASDVGKEKVDTYEEEQEDNAIINYQELINATKGIKEERGNSFQDIKDMYINDIENEFVPLEEPVLEEPIVIEDIKDNNPKDFDSADIRSLLREKSHLNVKETKIEEKEITYGSSMTDNEFHNSLFISPIHGTKGYPDNFIKEDKKETKNFEEIVEEIEIENENSLNFCDLSDNIKSNDDFLASLKQLRDNISH